MAASRFGLRFRSLSRESRCQRGGVEEIEVLCHGASFKAPGNHGGRFEQGIIVCDGGRTRAWSLGSEVSVCQEDRWVPVVVPLAIDKRIDIRCRIGDWLENGLFELMVEESKFLSVDWNTQCTKL